uniref:Uncharacterized protein n=1 Tax=Amphimedon queenslandica TaxID=400682 RepID=A0A1X7VS00_AMPQE
MFYDKDHSTTDTSSDDGIVDALWCQSSDPEAVGTWYFPNDTEVPTFDGEFGNDSAPRPVFAKSFDGQVALARREGLLGYEGLYKCVISDENRVNQTLVAGIYRTRVYKANEGPRLSSAVTYNLISVLPLHASLNFNVTRSPPTYLNSTVNNTILLSFSCTVIDGPSSVTGVSATVRERYAGRYEFMVSNNRVTDSKANEDYVPAFSDSRSLTIG